MHQKKYFRVALALFLTVTLSSLIDSHKADAHAPVAFIIQPYYGAHGYFQRWVAGSHYGIDFMMDWEPVLAAASGNIEFAGWFNATCHDEDKPGCNSTSLAGFGLFMRINHGPTEGHMYRSIYGHLSVVRSGLGQISQGQWVGTSGDSGYSNCIAQLEVGQIGKKLIYNFGLLFNTLPCIDPPIFRAYSSSTP